MDQTRTSAPVPAFVLHRHAYRDTSLILELFTLSRGRIGAVARGARGPRSRWRALVEPFQPVLVSWQGRGELVTVTGLESVGRPLRLPGARLASAFYVNELMLRMVRRDDPVPEVFAAYGEVLERLAGDANESVCLRLFEKRLLQGLGYGLLLDRTADTGLPLQPQALYRFEAEHGPLPATAPGKRIFSGRGLLALHSENLDDVDVQGEARRLMRLALAPYLGSKPLQSRALYRQLQGSSVNLPTEESSDD
ncbi:MAG: DNA repair protein RecO [Aquisalimonadaceae bacterium]